MTWVSMFCWRRAPKSRLHEHAGLRGDIKPAFLSLGTIKLEYFGVAPNRFLKIHPFCERVRRQNRGK